MEQGISVGDAPDMAAACEPRKKRYLWSEMGPFFAMHLAVLGVFWSGVTWQSVVVCVALYFIRMFAITGGYHRYFSHRTYKTSRVFQFVLAFIAQTSSQRGALWWAAHHRAHHLYSDTERDIHSPKQRGFWHSHVLWIFEENDQTDWKRIQDFAKFPELVFLNKHWMLPPVILGVAVWAIWGWPGLFVGFFLSTVITWHGTFTINSLAHVFGSRRYETSDTSRNNWFLALITLGEGWHNNHHHYMNSVKQGFFWWEVDVTYYVLRALAAVGVVWDLKMPQADKIAVPQPAPQWAAAETRTKTKASDRPPSIRPIAA